MPSKKKTTPPQGFFARSSRLIGLAAGIAASELGHRAGQAIAKKKDLEEKLKRLQTQVEQAKKIVQELGKLKGAAMKAGQLFSHELQDYLPPEVIEILSQLQNRAPQVDFQELKAVLEKELGSPLPPGVLSIQEKPMATASIGQVHEAELKLSDGRSVSAVIKIQFPGVAESVQSDVALLKTLVTSLLRLSLKSISFEEVFAEVQSVLVLETDYRNEAQMCARYREKVAKSGLQFRVPEVFSEFSGSRVLAMSREPGLTLTDWLKTSPSLEKRTQIGKLFLNLYFLEFFRWGLVQTDPNFGNFLIHETSDGQMQLVLLDFGATREYPQAFIVKYRKLLVDAFEGRRDLAMRACYEMKLISEKESDAVKEVFWRLLMQTLEPFRPEMQPFSFKGKRHVDETRKILLEMMPKLKHSPPPRDLIFLHRKLGGVYQAIKALGLDLDLVPVWENLKNEKDLD
ncbi:MAG: AarF/ABC1/UbiB kinase family protein [Bdellovibrionales bacterium]|nr:AarF/ABC1/UbiB kinase family protein [Bdellovibrionales bacterium]